MVKALLTLVGVTLISIASYAQREVGEGSTWKERLYFGGGMGLNGGTFNGIRYTYVGLNPIVGYMVSQNFSVGTGINWQHYRYSDFGRTTINQYGVSPFVRRNFDQLFVYGEYNLFNTPTFNTAERKTFDRLLLGVGYSQPIGGRSSVNAMALYDLIYDNLKGAFASPWVFRVFFTF